MAVTREEQTERLDSSTIRGHERRRLLVGVVAGALVAFLVIGVGVVVVVTRPAKWSARSTLVILPAKAIDVGTAAGYYDTLSRGQIVATFAEILHLAQVVNSAAANAGVPTQQRGQIGVAVNAVPNTALVAVTVTADDPATAEKMADAVAQSGQSYIANLSSPYAAVLVSKSAGTASRNRLGLSKLLVVLLVAGLAAGIGTQQAANQLYPLMVRRRQPEPAPVGAAPAATQEGDSQWWAEALLGEAEQNGGPSEPAPPARPVEPAPLGTVERAATERPNAPAQPRESTRADKR